MERVKQELTIRCTYVVDEKNLSGVEGDLGKIRKAR